MKQTTSQQFDPNPAGRESYAFMGSTSFSQYMTTTRSATKQAAFLLPHLRPGMTLLDCGCGPGSITVGLAEIVAPGRVTGIDVDAVQIERAQGQATERELVNVHFETGSAYALPFPDESFDAVFSHALLEHLQDPLQALKEMYRVVKPEGVVGIRTRDWEGLLLSPSEPLLLHSIELWERLSEHNGGNPRVGKHLRALLHQARFSRAEVSASYDCHATLETTRQWSTFWAAELLGKMGNQFVELGWVDRARLEKMSAAWTTWAERPDAFLARAFCEAAAWRESDLRQSP